MKKNIQANMDFWKGIEEKKRREKKKKKKKKKKKTKTKQKKKIITFGEGILAEKEGKTL